MPIHTHTHPFNGPLSGTTRVSRYQKGKTNLDFTEARDSEWQWHQLGHMQVSTSLQSDNHASTPPLSFLQAGCPSCRPANSVKALKAMVLTPNAQNIDTCILSKHDWPLTGINVVAFFCAYNVWIIVFVFAVLKQWLLQQSETEASFVYMIISMGADPCLLSHSLPSFVFPATFYNPFPAVKQPLL